MGKSLYIKKLRKNLVNDISYCIVPIHGPKVDFDSVVELLSKYTPKYKSLKKTYQIIHIDIDCEVRI